MIFVVQPGAIIRTKGEFHHIMAITLDAHKIISIAHCAAQ